MRIYHAGSLPADRRTSGNKKHKLFTDENKSDINSNFFLCMLHDWSHVFFWTGGRVESWNSKD